MCAGYILAAGGSLRRSKARSKVRSKAKQKRVKKRAVAALVVLLISVAAVIGYAWYGLSNRPIVDYTFGDAKDVRLSYRLIASTQNYPGSIDLVHVLMRNRGRTDISVIVTVHAVNALVSADYYGPYNEMTSVALMSSAHSEYRYVTFYLTLKSQVSSFVVSCQVSKFIDYTTFSSSIASTFGDIQPVSPTLLQYSRGSTSPYDYELVRQP